MWFYFFFFQAEDGIRDYKVTGVQTCALPICTTPRMFLRTIGGAKVANEFRQQRSTCGAFGCLRGGRFGDRKSTRLNSSHLVISYAVFCLKKKKKKKLN